MKISQMIHFPLGGAGAGIVVDNLARYLVLHGHVVRVLCADHNPPQFDYPVDAVLFADGHNQKSDVPFDFPVFLAHPMSHGKVFGQLTETERTLYTNAFRRKIEQMLNEFQPNIIHIHHGWIIASVVAEYNVPYVISLHGTERDAFERFPSYREAALKGLHGARFIMALNETERERSIETYKLDPTKISLARSGTDTNTFKPFHVDKPQFLARFGIRDAGHPVVFFGGRLIPLKGVDNLLRAAEIYEQTPEHPLTLIAGDGESRGDLEKLARELKLKHVYFLGHQDRATMAKLFNVADVTAMPSLADAFPQTALESLACGTPVVASRVGGLVHIITDQVGMLIEPGDAHALAANVMHLIRERFKQEVCSRAVEHVHKIFSMERTVTDLEQIYARFV